MPDCEVQVHGAGWAGLAITKGLRDAGVNVRLVDPAGALGGASGRSLGLVLPMHPEHPHRLEAGIGTAGAAALVDFIRAGLDQLPGLARVGVDWRASPQEEGELDLALAAAARIGVGAMRIPGGYHLHDGGVVDLAVLHATLAGPEVHAEAVTAEIDVYATGAVALDPFLADKITPVRWQSVHFDAGPLLAIPVVSQHATVFWTGGPDGLDAAGARWATPHMEVGETVAEPEPRVTTMLERLTRQAFPEAGALVGARAAIVGESCDGLPIVGPIPGRPRAIVCTGFGVAGLAYALPCARAVVDGILGRPTRGVPAPLRVTRFG
ncbi:MAG: FAD-dependent oxidoreductase [Myxococcota bacterium]